MNILLEADTKISELWGMRKAQSGIFRLITYSIVADTDGTRLIHNCITGELVQLNAEETELAKTLPCSYAPWMDELIAKHFLVPEYSDDYKTVESLKSLLSTINKKDYISKYVVLPTTHCNAKCFYCYEGEFCHENMSDETADKLVSFIEEHRNGHPIRMSWFGGEPLVGIKKIDRICSALKERGIEFDSDIVTNGILFNEEIAKRAKEDWNLVKAQITLDGTEEIHNRTKAYTGSFENPYKQTLKNIQYLLDNRVLVYVRLNIGLHNVSVMRELIEELYITFPDRQYLKVYTNLLYNESGTVDYTDEELAFLNKEKEKLDSVMFEKEMGLEYEIPRLRTSHCMADGDEWVLVTPSGKLGKCDFYITEHLVGDLDTGITDFDTVNRFKEKKSLPHCKNCSIFPHCICLKMCANLVCTYEEYERLQTELQKRMIVYYKGLISDNNIKN